jgi:hypothetical protein
MGTILPFADSAMGLRLRGCLTELSKEEAREETLRRWRALPAEDRETDEQLQFFAAVLAEKLEFRTMANSRKLILSWLQHERAGLPPWGKIPPESETNREAAE